MEGDGEDLMTLRCYCSFWTDWLAESISRPVLRRRTEKAQMLRFILERSNG